MQDEQNSSPNTNPVFQLYKETNEHLLADETPSVFIREAASRPEFQTHPFLYLYRLKDVEQTPKYHPEGNVFNHTLMVVDEAAKVKSKSEDARPFMWAALLHDIGKANATRKINGKITAYHHDAEGTVLAEEFLSFFHEDDDFIHRVCVLVRFHMQILYVTKGMPYADIQGMREQGSIKEIALLGLCDRLGRGNVNRPEEENNIRLFLKRVTG